MLRCSLNILGDVLRKLLIFKKQKKTTAVQFHILEFGGFLDLESQNYNKRICSVFGTCRNFFSFLDFEGIY